MPLTSHVHPASQLVQHLVPSELFPQQFPLEDVAPSGQAIAGNAAINMNDARVTIANSPIIFFIVFSFNFWFVGIFY